jgi:hypothetical protein
LELSLSNRGEELAPFYHKPLGDLSPASYAGAERSSVRESRIVSAILGIIATKIPEVVRVGSTGEEILSRNASIGPTPHTMQRLTPPPNFTVVSLVACWSRRQPSASPLNYKWYGT